MWGPTSSGYAQPYYPDRSKLSYAELMALFGRTPDDTRWIGSADSQEYLAVVTLLVQFHKPHDGERG